MNSDSLVDDTEDSIEETDDDDDFIDDNDFEIIKPKKSNSTSKPIAKPKSISKPRDDEMIFDDYVESSEIEILPQKTQIIFSNRTSNSSNNHSSNDETRSDAAIFDIVNTLTKDLEKDDDSDIELIRNSNDSIDNNSLKRSIDDGEIEVISSSITSSAKKRKSKPIRKSAIIESSDSESD
jgi:hypothetical protein